MKAMNIVLFSKDTSVLDNWQTKLHGTNRAHYKKIISCSNFKELGGALIDENHILLYHLANGSHYEDICYQFIKQYKRQHKMIVLVNSPDASQGLRIFRSGIHGYSNTYVDQKKLLVAIDVVEHGKIWIGSKVLKKLLDECGHSSSKPKPKKTFLSSLGRGIKKLFG